jgi:hypothetical protein
MSTHNEPDLIERLDRALDAITPRPAPVAEAVRQGRAIRTRRRMSAAAGLAVVAAAGVAAPLLLHRPPSPRPAAETVTVYPPGPGSPTGLIASGTVGSHRWRVSTDRPGSAVAGRGNQCFTALGVLGCGPVSHASQSAPVELTGTSAGGMMAEYGPVALDVSYLTVRLATGQLLTLHPATVFGTRYVAFAAPLHLAVQRVTAYSRHGELTTAVPFNAPAGPAVVNLWLAPGQPGLPRATRLVGSGTSAGSAWSVTGYLGPWGACVASRGGGAITSSCIGARPPLGTSVLGWSAGAPRVVYGSAAASVAHVLVTLASGRTIRVPAVQVGSQKFFAFALAPGQHAVGWHTYNAARQPVASGGPVGGS